MPTMNPLNSKEVMTTIFKRPPLWIRLSIGSVICALGSIIIGCGAWYILGNSPTPVNSNVVVSSSQAEVPIDNKSANKEEPSTTPTINIPEGTIPVPGGVVTMGGGKSNSPLQRVAVDPFFMAETEVTNLQYKEFITATEHEVPDGWIDDNYLPGMENYPVTGVTWQDAMDYCQWLSTKLGLTVRLPTEAEWEWAAKGRDNLIYPWGNEWNERAVDSKDGDGRIRAVRSFPLGRSPFGLYDMAGNVWEWVDQDALDEEGKIVVKDGITYKIVKGGAADEAPSYISASSRKEVPEDLAYKSLGFRYIVSASRPTNIKDGRVNLLSRNSSSINIGK
jgi:toxoflavin biosynthesis protein ToxD